MTCTRSRAQGFAGPLSREVSRAAVRTGSVSACHADASPTTRASPGHRLVDRLGARPHPARAGRVAATLAANAAARLPARLTLGQVRHYLHAERIPTARAPATVYVCENPSIAEAAAGALAMRCAPLVWPRIDPHMSVAEVGTRCARSRSAWQVRFRRTPGAGAPIWLICVSSGMAVGVSVTVALSRRPGRPLFWRLFMACRQRCWGQAGGGPWSCWLRWPGSGPGRVWR